MGKTAKGAVWLNEDLLSAYDYWQFWRNTDDSNVGTFLRRFTDIPMDEVERLEALQGAEINDAKVALANAATAMLHGASNAQAAERTAKATFEGGGVGRELPTMVVPSGQIGILEALTSLSFTTSNAEAKRKIAENAVRVDDILVPDANMVISVIPGQLVRLSLGKKKHGLLTR
jgi:tyrosyl-tRNA synthetase